MAQAGEGPLAPPDALPRELARALEDDRRRGSRPVRPPRRRSRPRRSPGVDAGERRAAGWLRRRGRGAAPGAPARRPAPGAATLCRAAGRVRGPATRLLGGLEPGAVGAEPGNDELRRRRLKARPARLAQRGGGVELDVDVLDLPAAAADQVV